MKDKKMVKTPIIWTCCASIEMKFKKKKINIKSSLKKLFKD